MRVFAKELEKYKNIIIVDHKSPLSNEAISLLKKKGVDYKIIPVELAGDSLNDIANKYGRNTLPIIFLEGKFIGGLDELERHYGGNKPSRANDTLFDYNP